VDDGYAKREGVVRCPRTVIRIFSFERWTRSLLRYLRLYEDDENSVARHDIQYSVRRTEFMRTWVHDLALLR